MAPRTISADYLARVEGEGAMHIQIVGDKVEEVRLEIFEPPRFFEAFLRGRSFTEPPDITARICGICPVAYQMSAVQALEAALGIEVDQAVRDLRRLLYCGEWIESHVLHVHMLHAPDFLGYAGAIEMSKDVPGVVERGLRMKKAGNAIVQTLGGREIHPINVRVGGFYKAPSRKAFQALVSELSWARDAAADTVRWVASLEIPEFERNYAFVALSHPHDYPMNEGRIVSSTGLDIAAAEYETYFEEEHVPHSTALHAHFVGGGNYLVGPLARFNLNAERLAPMARAMAAEVGLEVPCRNPFRSIVVRAVEVLHAFEVALELIERYRPPESAATLAEPGAGEGCGCTEAPRGILFHRYKLDPDGKILEARIVPPTSQNQPTIEDDLRHLVEANSRLADNDLQWRCEQAIRNYDPCISCSTHFLKLTVDRQ